MATALKPAAQTVNFHFQEDLTKGKELVSPPKAESPAVPLFDMFQDVVAKNKNALDAQAKSQEAAQKHIAEQQQTITALLAEVAALKKQVSTLESSGQKATLTHQAEMQSQSNLHTAETQRLQAQVAQLQAQHPAHFQHVELMKGVVEKTLKQLDFKNPPELTISSINPQVAEYFRMFGMLGHDDISIMLGNQPYYHFELVKLLQSRMDQSQCDLKVLLAQLETLQAQMRP